MTVLSLHDVSIRYGQTIAVHAASFDVAAGEVVALVGESGSGKSSLALALLRLLPPGADASGTILIDGLALGSVPERDLARARRGRGGMIFQDASRALNPVLKIGAQLAEALRLGGMKGQREIAARVRNLLEEVGLSDIPADRYAHQLSGGQRQRVCIAMALAGEPRLLIADEPTSALDASGRADVMNLLVRQARARAMALLVISHDLPLVGASADRILVMQGGEIVEHGDAARILAGGRESYTRALVASARGGTLRAPLARTGAPVLDVEGLSRRYPAYGSWPWRRKTVAAVENASFTLVAGETLAVVGESGSGKSTLMRMILGLERPDEGTVRVQGRALASVRGREERSIRRRMQAVFQDPHGSFDPRQTVAAAIAEPLYLLEDPPNHADRQARIESILERVGLDPAMGGRLPRAFSGGQRQRLAIARALIIEPDIIILDEAVSALDATVRADILRLLTELQTRLGLAYLFVSHDLDVVRSFAHRTLVMQRGRIVEEGPTQTLLADPQHPHTRALVEAMPHWPPPNQAS